VNESTQERAARAAAPLSSVADGVGAEVSATEAGDVVTSRRQVQSRPPRRRWVRRAAILLVSILVVGGGILAWATWRLSTNINRVDVSGVVGTDRPAVDPNAGKAVNLLLLGSDTRVGKGNDNYGEMTQDPGQHSDTNLFVHVSADRSWATAVSIPRDSMVPGPPECSPDSPTSQWAVRQWNTNYKIGGTGCVIRAFEGNTGIFVDHYAVVDFRGFKDMVDALGGVEVCTPEPIKDRDSELTLAAGRHRLDGEQALGYVRTRKSLGDGSDLGRIGRQQAFLSSIAQEGTSSELLRQPTKLYSFLSAATRSLTTDPEFDLDAMADLATSLRGIGLDRLEFITVPSETYEPDPNRVQWSPSAEQIWSALREDRRVGDSTPTPTPAPSASLRVSPAEVAVRIINSSGATGLARQARSGLEVQGFDEVSVAEGEVGTGGTLVEYSGDGADAAATVAAAFPGSRVVRTDGLGATVQVTLGERSRPVVEVPNRLGREPLPTPSVSPSPRPVTPIETRAANSDICS
jgi:LCP family protein required for cell wall assembly